MSDNESETLPSSASPSTSKTLVDNPPPAESTATIAFRDQLPHSSANAIIALRDPIPTITVEDSIANKSLHSKAAPNNSRDQLPEMNIGASTAREHTLPLIAPTSPSTSKNQFLTILTNAFSHSTDKTPLDQTTNVKSPADQVPLVEISTSGQTLNQPTKAPLTTSEAIRDQIPKRTIDDSIEPKSLRLLAAPLTSTNDKDQIPSVAANASTVQQQRAQPSILLTATAERDNLPKLVIASSNLVHNKLPKPTSQNLHVSANMSVTRASPVQQELTTAVSLDDPRVVYRQPAVTANATTFPRSSGILNATELLSQQSTITNSGVVSSKIQETELTMHSLLTSVSPQESHQDLANHNKAQRPVASPTEMDRQNVPTPSTSARAALALAQAHLSKNNIPYQPMELPSTSSDEDVIDYMDTVDIYADLYPPPVGDQVQSVTEGAISPQHDTAIDVTPDISNNNGQATIDSPSRAATLPMSIAEPVPVDNRQGTSSGINQVADDIPQPAYLLDTVLHPSLLDLAPKKHSLEEIIAVVRQLKRSNRQVGDLFWIKFTRNEHKLQTLAYELTYMVPHDTQVLLGLETEANDIRYSLLDLQATIYSNFPTFQLHEKENKPAPSKLDPSSRPSNGGSFQQAEMLITATEELMHYHVALQNKLKDIKASILNTTERDEWNPPIPVSFSGRPSRWATELDQFLFWTSNLEEEDKAMRLISLLRTTPVAPIIPQVHSGTATLTQILCALNSFFLDKSARLDLAITKAVVLPYQAEETTTTVTRVLDTVHQVKTLLELLELGSTDFHEGRLVYLLLVKFPQPLTKAYRKYTTRPETETLSSFACFLLQRLQRLTSATNRGHEHIPVVRELLPSDREPNSSPHHLFGEPPVRRVRLHSDSTYENQDPTVRGLQPLAAVPPYSRNSDNQQDEGVQRVRRIRLRSETPPANQPGSDSGPLSSESATTPNRRHSINADRHSRSNQRVMPTQRRPVPSRTHQAPASNPETLPAEASSSSRRNPNTGTSNHFRDQARSDPPTSSSSTTRKMPCPKCSRKHLLCRCEQFKHFTVNAKLRFVARKGLCTNCLREGHSQVNCPSEGRCLTCNGHHHTMLHTGSSANRSDQGSRRDESYNRRDRSRSPHQHPESSSNSENESRRSVHHFSVPAHVPGTSISLATLRPEALPLLPTAMLRVEGTSSPIMGHAILDACAQAHLVSSQFVQLLGLTPTRESHQLLMSGHPVDTIGFVHLTFASTNSTPSGPFTLRFEVLGNVALNQPERSFPIEEWEHIHGLTLADPYFNIRKPIDLVLGLPLVDDIHQGVKVYGRQGRASAYMTTFGYVLQGRIDPSPMNLRTTQLTSSIPTPQEPSSRTPQASSYEPNLPGPSSQALSATFVTQQGAVCSTEQPPTMFQANPQDRSAQSINDSSFMSTTSQIDTWLGQVHSGSLVDGQATFWSPQMPSGKKGTVVTPFSNIVFPEIPNTRQLLRELSLPLNQVDSELTLIAFKRPADEKTSRAIDFSFSTNNGTYRTKLLVDPEIFLKEYQGRVPNPLEIRPSLDVATMFASRSRQASSLRRRRPNRRTETESSQSSGIASISNEDYLLNHLESLASWHKAVRVLTRVLMIYNSRSFRIMSPDATQAWFAYYSRTTKAIRLIVQRLQARHYQEILATVPERRFKDYKLPERLSVLRLQKYQGFRCKHPYVTHDGTIWVRYNKNGITRSRVAIPGENTLVKSLIIETHIMLGHSTVKDTVSCLEAQYWIPNIRRWSKSVLNECNVCYRFRYASSFPWVPQIQPGFRTTLPPFRITRIELAGPYKVIDLPARDHISMWVICFVCSATHAIHFETIDEKSPKGIIIALLRFIAIYGAPAVLYSLPSPVLKVNIATISDRVVYPHCEKIEKLFARNPSWEVVLKRFRWLINPRNEQVFDWLSDCLELGVTSLLDHQEHASLTLSQLKSHLRTVSTIVNSRPLSIIQLGARCRTVAPRDFLPKMTFHLDKVRDKGLFSMDRKTIPFQNGQQAKALAQKAWRSIQRNYFRTLRESQSSSTLSVTFPEGQSVLIYDQDAPQEAWTVGKVLSESAPSISEASNPVVEYTPVSSEFQLTALPDKYVESTNQAPSVRVVPLKPIPGNAFPDLLLPDVSYASLGSLAESTPALRFNQNMSGWTLILSLLLSIQGAQAVSPSDLSPSVSTTIAYLGFFFIILGSAFNFFTLCWVVTRPPGRFAFLKVYRFMIASLAMLDLIKSIGLVPMDAFRFYLRDWIFGKTWCIAFACLHQGLNILIWTHLGTILFTCLLEPPAGASRTNHLVYAQAATFLLQSIASFVPPLLGLFQIWGYVEPSKVDATTCSLQYLDWYEEFALTTWPVLLTVLGALQSYIIRSIQPVPDTSTLSVSLVTRFNVLCLRYNTCLFRTCSVYLGSLTLETALLILNENHKAVPLIQATAQVVSWMAVILNPIAFLRLTVFSKTSFSLRPPRSRVMRNVPTGRSVSPTGRLTDERSPILLASRNVVVNRTDSGRQHDSIEDTNYASLMWSGHPGSTRQLSSVTISLSSPRPSSLEMTLRVPPSSPEALPRTSRRKMSYGPYLTL